jgi:hypothetical protein
MSHNGDYHSDFVMAGKTAMVRGRVSVPTRWLLENDRLGGDLLHHGRGRAEQDCEIMRDKAGHYCEYDPNYAADSSVLRREYDVVVSNFVINTLPPSPRALAWQQIAKCTKGGGVAYIAVRSSKDRSIKGVPFLDGVRTKRNTYQKGFTPEEAVMEGGAYFQGVQVVFRSPTCIILECRKIAYNRP